MPATTAAAPERATSAPVAFQAGEPGKVELFLLVWGDEELGGIERWRGRVALVGTGKHLLTEHHAAQALLVGHAQATGEGGTRTGDTLASADLG